MTHYAVAGDGSWSQATTPDGAVHKEFSSKPTEINAAWVPVGDDAVGWVRTYRQYDWQGRPTLTTLPTANTAEAGYGGCGCAGGGQRIRYHYTNLSGTRSFRGCGIVPVELGRPMTWPAAVATIRRQQTKLAKSWTRRTAKNSWTTYSRKHLRLDT